MQLQQHQERGKRGKSDGRSRSKSRKSSGGGGAKGEKLLVGMEAGGGAAGQALGNGAADGSDKPTSQTELYGYTDNCDWGTDDRR